MAIQDNVNYEKIGINDYVSDQNCTLVGGGEWWVTVEHPSVKWPTEEPHLLCRGTFYSKFHFLVDSADKSILVPLLFIGEQPPWRLVGAAICMTWTDWKCGSFLLSPETAAAFQITHQVDPPSEAGEVQVMVTIYLKVTIYICGLVTITVIFQELEVVLQKRWTDLKSFQNPMALSVTMH